MQAQENQKFRVLILSGSQRRKKDWPQRDSKSSALMKHMMDRLPKDWIIDFEDLGNVKDRERIQPCNACVSSSMALCCWPCNCYAPNDKKMPDLLWNLDMYARLEAADAWAIISPVNWNGPTSNLKLMFDRLVCMNGGNPRPDLIEKDGFKNADKAAELEHTKLWSEISQNHLEGRTAGFFIHGDFATEERGEDGRPVALRHKEYFDFERDELKDQRDTYKPLVHQCRYSGIEVPDHLWRYELIGYRKLYSDNQIEDIEPKHYETFNMWVDNFKTFVTKKGKVPHAKYPVHVEKSNKQAA